MSVAMAPRPNQNTRAHEYDQQKQSRVLQGGVMRSVRVIELQLVAFIMVFSASGLVPLFDLAFPIFASLYLLALSRLAFPSYSYKSNELMKSDCERRSSMFRAYEIVGTTLGLFLPLAYVLGGFARGDEHAVRSATPHLFLLSFQILTHNLITALSLFSPPVRALVPLLYTVRGIFVILDWINDVWLNKTLPSNANFQDIAWCWFGKSLAVANLGYFSVNLFCFLIPIFLPRAFERYFKDTGEISSKMAEDKSSASSTLTVKKSQAPNNKSD
ncbi:Transmembrane protein [Quillaja saponaria]|uniref:Transmembrane protein n=1 Tax=Quillaja saponaria TaxID=32244 RepID=A0AAD7PJY2_QUISA|nr:Transmembrane protein [Quillaja saponaria]